MSIIHMQLRQYVRRLLAVQVLTVGAASLLALGWRGDATAVAVAYGGGIAMAGTFILIWYGRRAERTGCDVSRNAGLVYGSAITRFATAVVMFTLGIAVLHLEPPALFGGFGAGLLAQFLSVVLVSGKQTWRATR